MASVTKLSILLLLLALFPPPSTAQPSPNNPNDGYPYTRFSPSMAIIIVILIAALFIMGFFSIYIRNCAQSNNGGGLGALGAAGRSRRNASRGLDAETIATFPTMVYSEVKGLKIGKEALECAVCLNEFEEEETLRLIPKCDHVFHPDCIDAWLASHTTCPVCRANLVPQPGDPVVQPAQPEADLEAQTEAISEPESNDEQRRTENATVDAAEPEVMDVNKTLNRNRTRGRGSRSGRPPRFPRSHSTGHSLVQPGENTDRFTLRLPAEVRKQIMTRELSRSSSMVLPRGGSSRRGYRTGEGSSRGKHFRRPEISDRVARSDRWSFNRIPSFLRRAPSVKSPSIKSPKVAAIDGGETSSSKLGEAVGDSSRPPV